MYTSKPYNSIQRWCDSYFMLFAKKKKELESSADTRFARKSHTHDLVLKIWNSTEILLASDVTEIPHSDIWDRWNTNFSWVKHQAWVINQLLTKTKMTNSNMWHYQNTRVWHVTSLEKHPTWHCWNGNFWHVTSQKYQFITHDINEISISDMWTSLKYQFLSGNC